MSKLRINNIDYLEGLIDGYGIQEPIGEDDFPEGINNINDIYDKIEELKEIQLNPVKKIPINELPISRLPSSLIENIKLINPRFAEVVSIDNIRRVTVIRYRIKVPKSLRHLNKGAKYLAFFLADVNMEINKKMSNNNEKVTQIIMEQNTVILSKEEYDELRELQYNLKKRKMLVEESGSGTLTFFYYTKDKVIKELLKTNERIKTRLSGRVNLLEEKLAKMDIWAETSIADKRSYMDKIMGYEGKISKLKEMNWFQFREWKRNNK